MIHKRPLRKSPWPGWKEINDPETIIQEGDIACIPGCDPASIGLHESLADFRNDVSDGWHLWNRYPGKPMLYAAPYLGRVRIDDEGMRAIRDQCRIWRPSNRFIGRMNKFYSRRLPIP